MGIVVPVLRRRRGEDGGGGGLTLSAYVPHSPLCVTAVWCLSGVAGHMSLYREAPGHSVLFVGRTGLVYNPPARFPSSLPSVDVTEV